MNLGETIVALADAATADLIALGKAIYDVLEGRANALQKAAVEAAEVAADVAEAEKFGPLAQDDIATDPQTPGAKRA